MNFPDTRPKPTHHSSEVTSDASDGNQTPAGKNDKPAANPAANLDTDIDPSEQLTVPDDLRDIADWTDDGLSVREPSAAFATNAVNPSGDLMTTIGHIGRYALKSRIGEGGLGTVYAAHDPLLSRLIAIKTLSLNIAPEQRDAFNGLFFNEARAAAGLSHPHIVTVFDAGISDDNAYIAMELLSGLDLRQLRMEGWRATATQAALIVRRVADALAYAHGKGVIHRDVKPANIFMVGRTQPRVLDFGIARMAHLHEVPSEDEVAGGSPFYMAPEQIRRQPIDKRADVFSLGVVLYELLTDEKPFRGNTLDEITHAVVSHVPAMAHKVKANVPVVLSEITAKAMAKDPEKRHRSARALSRELRQWLEENSAPSDDTEVPERNAKPAKKTLPVWLLPAAAGVLGTGLVGAAVVWGLASSQPPTLQMANAGTLVTERASASSTVASSPVANSPEASSASAELVVLPAPQAQTALKEISTADVVKSVPVQTNVALVGTDGQKMATVAAPRLAPAMGSADAVPNAPAIPIAKTEAAKAVANRSAPVVAAVTAAVAPAAVVPAAVAVAAAAAVEGPAPAPATGQSMVQAQPPKESVREKRARETKERAAAKALAAATKPAAAPALVTGVLRLAVSPWGQVEVDGKPVGTTPPLNELTLREGKHQVTLRNDDFPPHSITVTVTAGQPVSVKHKFGS